MVTHAGASDLPILERAVGARPAGLFDVQLAAGFVGLGMPSLSSLVSILLGERLDKSEQLTDWSTRPLSEAAQLYAAADVDHLLPLAVVLGHRLEDLGRESWAASECERLRTAELRQSDPDTAWWKIKGATGLRGKKACIAQAVAAWRERQRNGSTCRRVFVLPELALAAVVGRPPKTVDEALGLRGVTRMSTEAAKELVAAVEVGRTMDKSQLRPPVRVDDVPELDAAVALLVAYVAELSAKESRSIASSSRRVTTSRTSSTDARADSTTAGAAPSPATHSRRLLGGEAVVRLVDGGRRLRLEQ